MASNKKAQILAAVMCASSIFGSYTMVSAESSISGNNSSVVAGNGTITATAENGSNQTSKITLNGNSLSIDLAKNNNVYDGTFSLNSKYLNVNKYNGTVTVKGTTYTSDLANNGLTIKNSSSTLASLNNNGLNIYDGTNTKATATITKAGAITGTGLTVKAASDTIKPEGNYVESKVTTSGVADTIKQGGFTRATSNVTTNSIKDTIYTDSGTELSSINVFKNTAANGIENGKVSLTAKKIVTDNQTSTTTTSTLTLGGDNASLKVGNYGFTIDSNNNVLFSGKNASLTSTGLIVNGTGTSSIKSTNTNENSSTVGSYTKNDISYNGMTTTARGGKNPSESDNVNKTTSAVTYTGVTDTVYDDGGNLKTKSSVTTSGITNTVNDVSTGKALANSSLTTSGISNTTTDLVMTGTNEGKKMSTALYQNSNGISASATKKDEDGNTTGGISTTGAVTGTSLIITAENTAGNKTTSTVGATGVTDAVYGTDGARVAYSNVGTGGISNTTSLKTTTGKIDTAINQNTSGIGISSTKYDTNNKVTDKTSLTMNGSANNITSIKYNDSNKTAETTSVSVNGATSSITSYGNYVYGEDGKATSYNQASISLNGNTGTATIRGGSIYSSTLTLNEAGVALSGKNVGLNANGLTLYKDVDGVKTQYASLSAGGLDVKGTGSTTIKSTNATTGAIGQSQVSYDGVTDSFTKDDVTNSVTTNANGTTFSSTENGSTTIKGDTIKTTNLIVNGKDIGGVATDVAGIDRNTENEDGLGYYTQIEGKTKIYNTGRFSTANGNFVVDPYGSITSKAGNYRFNMDRTSGFDLGYAATTSFTLDNTGVSLGFRNNSFILDKNGATFINANGENVSFTSINGGTITTGETVINGSSITTKDLYVDNIHLNGAITDGNGNVVGGGDLSLGADGTLDLKYNANGIINTFVSGATGVHSSFSNGTTTASSSVGYIDDKNTIGIKDQVGNTSVTTTTDGTTFANGSGSTTINGGNITTTGDVTVGGDLSVGDNFKVDGTTGNVTGGTYNGVQISTDKDGNAIIGGTNIGDLATNEEVNKVNDKVDAVDNKVGDTSKLDKEITDNQNYKDNPNLVGAVNAEADIRRNEISRIDGQIEQLDGRVGSLENRMSDVEDRIDKVGAMSAAIANLRTMGFDPEAPTEIAIGVGQYKSETGLALGVFHYPNQDFMLSASISTSGDEVMGGIGATWKLGRKSAAEKAKDEEARRLEKAEEMKKLAQDAKVKAQAERHAKLLAEREAQKTA